MESDFFGRDVISIEDFSREDIDYVISLASEIKLNPENFRDVLTGKVVVPLFFENSTRTNLSFQMACLQMGGVMADFDSGSSSLKKGETLSDTIQMIQGYNPDVVIMRHPYDGAAQLAADILDAPLINAGDGKNQHPTQTMLDLFSINEICGGIDEVSIALVGDLKYGRTVHSLIVALAKYNNPKIYFVSPESLKIPEIYLNVLKEKGIEYSEHKLFELSEVIKNVDIVYMTRIQRERFPEGPEGEQEYERIKDKYCLEPKMLAGVHPNLKIMHPLPKVFEIDLEIDKSNYAYYFQQAENGLYVRKALLKLLTENGKA